MRLKEKVKIYDECNQLFNKNVQENPDGFQMEYGVGDEVLTIVGEKYGLSKEEVEGIYLDVQMIYTERAYNRLCANSNTVEN